MGTENAPGLHVHSGLMQRDPDVRRDAAEPIAVASDTALIRLPAGESITVRVIAPSDAAAYLDILERTTEEDRYCRFFHVVNHFDLSHIERFVDPRPDTVGFIAEDELGPLGVAHLFFISPTSAEIAIVVARDARSHGVGHLLLERLITEARAQRCRTLTAYALSLNSAFSHLARSVGMTPSGPPDDTVTWLLELAPN